MTMTSESRTAVDLDAPLAITSGDSHFGPRMEDLRPYCPAAFLDQFDEYAKAFTAGTGPRRQEGSPSDESPEAKRHAWLVAQSVKSPGNYEPHQRLREMDRDGVVSEVIYHGTFNGNTIPFVGGPIGPASEMELQAVGYELYNRWLADACSVAPERLLGAMHLPLWDLERSLAELRWARDAGLRTVSFPAPRRGIPFYDDPVWDSFWSACEDMGVVLSTHAGAIDREDLATPGAHEVFLRMLEAGGWPARRAINRFVFGGVFERHPGLKLVLAEQSMGWWETTSRDFDSAYNTNGWMIRDQVPKMPSEYLREHVFIAASFMAPFEAESAVREDCVANVMWGRDYPHPEGTWVYQEHDDDENMTRLSLRNTFNAIAPEHTKAMLSDNGIRVYGLDGGKLEAIAAEIGAPSIRDLSAPLDWIPEPGQGGIMAFRTLGAWG